MGQKSLQVIGGGAHSTACVDAAHVSGTTEAHLCGFDRTGIVAGRAADHRSTSVHVGTGEHGGGLPRRARGRAERV